MQTGEDIQGLRKIIDLTRLIGGFILAVHFYICCYHAFKDWHWTAAITDLLIGHMAKIGLFDGFLKPKAAALLCLVISVSGIKGRKDEQIRHKSIAVFIGGGMLLYWFSALFFYLHVQLLWIAAGYIFTTVTGYLLMLTGGAWLSRLLKDKLDKDIFNTDNESFPQQEALLANEYSVNLPARYHLKGQVRDSWINIINPFRGILVPGTPGAGKTYFVVRNVIDQHLKKGFSMLIYDFKFDDLTRLAYNKLAMYKQNYTVKPAFYVINFDDLNRTHRCNPLDPGGMKDITDAAEASRTIMMGLNREWIRKQGDFFVESPINFLTALMWYLRKYEDGRYCTLPHVIELMQVDYAQLFAVLQEEEEIQALINPFILAYNNNAKAQLEGQVASAKIGLSRLSSPSLYYVLSGNDFTLDLNNPDAPKVICLGNNPQKLQTYGAVLSLYISRIISLVNRKGQLKSSLIFDEFPTIFFNNIDSLIATARSNKVSATLVMQDFSQLKKDYGAEQADVITGIVGNIISGQVMGDTSKKLADNFGKIVQDKNSMTINSGDTSFTKATQLDYAIPASKIASLSSGEFVGMVADNPDQRIELKLFHNHIQNDHEAIALEEAAYKPLPLINYVSPEDVEENYKLIKRQIAGLIKLEMEKVAQRNPEAVNDDAGGSKSEPGKPIEEAANTVKLQEPETQDKKTDGVNSAKAGQQQLERSNENGIVTY